MTGKRRCILDHPHPGRECRPPAEVYRNRWGGAPSQPPPEPVDGQLALDEAVPGE
jgi:hypothetical protein